MRLSSGCDTTGACRRCGCSIPTPGEIDVAMNGEIHLVGGAVRDELLGLAVKERDWVVVGSTPEAMRAAGFRQADPEFPVFLHPETGEEYALARREYKTGQGYRGFRIEAGPDVGLEEDLARRDLTINAMARDATGRLIDPFDGQQDLDQGLLRHVTPAFTEDPVRLLRIARFAARFGGFGFRVAHSTHRLLKDMVKAGAVQELQPQRIRQEMDKALLSPQPWRFFEVLHACGALQQLIPGLAAGMQSGHGRGETDIATRALHAAVAQAAQTGPEVRLTALLLPLEDDPEVLQARLGLSRRVLKWLKTGRKLWPGFERLGELDACARESLLAEMGAWRQGDAFETLLLVFGVQPGGSDSGLDAARMREAGARIDVAALRDRGLTGEALGRAIRQARCEVLAEAGY